MLLLSACHYKQLLSVFIYYFSSSTKQQYSPFDNNIKLYLISKFLHYMSSTFPKVTKKEFPLMSP